MRVLLGTLWLALACGSVHATLSKSDAKKAASKTLLEKVGAVWRRAEGLSHRASLPAGAVSRELGLWAACAVPPQGSGWLAGSAGAASGAGARGCACPRWAGLL